MQDCWAGHRRLHEQLSTQEHLLLRGDGQHTCVRAGPECKKCVIQVVWPSASTLDYRDQQIEDIFMFYVENRLLQEYIYGTASRVLSNNQNCYEAYKMFLCQFNIPTCDPKTLQTVPTCKSVCTMFFNSCQSSSDACDIIYVNQMAGLDSSC
jgi:hypothetical protein